MRKFVGPGDRIGARLQALGYWKNEHPDVLRFCAEKSYRPQYVYAWLKDRVPTHDNLRRLATMMERAPSANCTPLGRKLGGMAPRIGIEPLAFTSWTMVRRFPTMAPGSNLAPADWNVASFVPSMMRTNPGCSPASTEGIRETPPSVVSPPSPAFTTTTPGCLVESRLSRTAGYGLSATLSPVSPCVTLSPKATTRRGSLAPKSAGSQNAASAGPA